MKSLPCIEEKNCRKNQIKQIYPNLRKRRVFIRECNGPQRKVIKKRRFEPCHNILGSFLVFGILVDRIVTISCPGGQINTMCSPEVVCDIWWNNPNRYGHQICTLYKLETKCVN